MVAKVSVNELPFMAIQRFFRNNGFVPAYNNCHVEIESPDQSDERYQLGVLKQEDLKPRYFLGFIRLQPRRPRRLLVGILYYHKHCMDKRIDVKNWLFKVYGRDSLPMAKDLAIKIGSDFDVHIIVELVEEGQKYEKYCSENSCMGPDHSY